MGFVREFWEDALKDPMWPDRDQDRHFLVHLRQQIGIQAFLRAFKHNVDAIDQAIVEAIVDDPFDWRKLLKRLHSQNVIVFARKSGKIIENFNEALDFFHEELVHQVHLTTKHTESHGREDGTETGRAILCFTFLWELADKRIIKPKFHKADA